MEKKKGNVLEFPKLRRVKLSDKKTVDTYARKHEPYADYNFNNYYSWDTENIHSVSKLNGNLVLQFADYVDGKPFFSFIGKKKPVTTALALLQTAKKLGQDAELRLIPRFIATKLKRSKAVTVTEDETSHDYILSIPEIADLKGRKYKNKRQAANFCEQKYRVNVFQKQFNSKTLAEISNFLKTWEASKKLAKKNADVEYEKFAIKRMLRISKGNKKVILTMAYVENRVVGFSVDELLRRNYVLSHYFKTLPEYQGLTEFLNRSVARYLQKRGFKHWNWQQDLGIHNLRNMKLGYRPKKKLKKYTVTLT